MYLATSVLESLQIAKEHVLSCTPVPTSAHIVHRLCYNKESLGSERAMATLA